MTGATHEHSNRILLLLLSGTILGLAATDLILPAIPVLPAAFNSGHTQAQWVLASFVSGTAVGLLLFGELGARFNQARLLLLALIGFATTSALAANASHINTLIAIRFVQGLTGSAAAVFAPGMIRALLPEHQAIRALGLMGAVESLTPALAPLLGAWLLATGDWRTSFFVLAILATGLVILCVRQLNYLPKPPPLSKQHHYVSLLMNWPFMRQAISQAGTLGALLVFVFAAPAIMVGPMAGSLSDFIVMQIIGVSLFITASTNGHRLVARFSAGPVIFWGTALSAIGSLSLLAYALTCWATDTIAQAHWVWPLFAILNVGMGVRGPPGFFAAMQAAGADSARAAALVIVLVMLVTALGTALVAPFINQLHIGLIAASLASSLLACGAVGCLIGARYPTQTNNR